ncbi:hypothetical protein [Paraburkholderia flava]|uniref:hypothetical protein n=1 Tax=Paraburkholderia flava TaxID=2547393 RepID=UPI001061C203|nr:hypothetical protein [Paraburkholderia flava]
MRARSVANAVAGRCSGATAALVAMFVSTVLLAACAPTPADPVPFKPVPADRIFKPDIVQPGEGLVAVDLRRERSADVIVRFRDALVYVDGVHVADMMNGERLAVYLSPGPHRIGVSTQFDPLVEFSFPVDSRYTNHAIVVFNSDHRVTLRRVPK